MRTGGCLCHPSTAEQQRLDRQHLHDDDHPDPSTLFYTHDQLIQLRVSDQMEPVRGEQRALAFRGARQEKPSDEGDDPQIPKPEKIKKKMKTS